MTILRFNDDRHVERYRLNDAPINAHEIIERLGENHMLGGLLWQTLGTHIQENLEAYQFEQAKSLVERLLVAMQIATPNEIEFLIGFLEFYTITLYDLIILLWDVLIDPDSAIMEVFRAMDEMAEFIVFLLEEGVTLEELKMAFVGFNEAVFEDLLWLIDNSEMFLPWNFIRLSNADARNLGRRTGGATLEFASGMAIASGGYKIATGAFRAAKQVIIAWRSYLKVPASINGTLNIGAGNRPTQGAFNIDANPRVAGVHFGDATRLSNIKTGSQSRIIIENPYNFDPLNPEVLRVLQLKGRVELTGSYANHYFREAVRRADTLGLQQVGTRIQIQSSVRFYNTQGHHMPGTFYKYIFELVN